ncbi:hypothetical protein [Nostoc sp. DSM 114159]
MSVCKGAVIGIIESIQIQEAGETLDRVDSASRYIFYANAALYPQLLSENGAINDPPSNRKDSPLYPQTSQT